MAAGKLRKVEASGGPPQDICDAPGFSGGTWNREGTIVFGSTTGLWRVSAEGGKPEAVSSLEPGESGHFWPHFLPDGRRYLYTAWTGEAARRAIVAGTLGSKEKIRVLAAALHVADTTGQRSEHRKASQAREWDKIKGFVHAIFLLSDSREPSSNSGKIVEIHFAQTLHPRLRARRVLEGLCVVPLGDQASQASPEDLAAPAGDRAARAAGTLSAS